MPYKDIEKRRACQRRSIARKLASKEGREHENARQRRWRSANPEKTKLRRRRCRLKNLYGLTLEGYDAMLKAQNNCCAICGNSLGYDGHFTLFIDHDHKTGKVRGALCGLCNGALSLLEKDSDWTRKATEYLRKNWS